MRQFNRPIPCPPTCVRLQQIPGVDPLVSTAVVSAIGNGAAFKKGREFAAWLDLIPRQWSSGGNPEEMSFGVRQTRFETLLTWGATRL